MLLEKSTKAVTNGRLGRLSLELCNLDDIFLLQLSVKVTVLLGILYAPGKEVTECIVIMSGRGFHSLQVKEWRIKNPHI